MSFDNSQNFAGKTVVDFERGKPLKKLEKTAYRLRIEYDDEHTVLDLITEMLEDPAVDRLEALVIGAWMADDVDRTSAEIVEMLVAAAAQLPSLSALFLGDICMEECEVSWIHQADLSPLWSAYPRLREFQVRGGEGLQLGRLTHDHLQRLVVECGGLPRNVLQEIASARLPALEHLELYLGDSGYGWNGSIADVKPLLKPARFPKLRYLGLRDSEIADEVAKAVAKSAILKQVEVLDLSLGVLGDEGGKALLACPDWGSLKKLDLHHHYLSDEVMRDLKKLSIKVDVSDQQTEGEYGRYVSVGE